MRPLRLSLAAPLLALATTAQAQSTAGSQPDWKRHVYVGYVAPNPSLGNRFGYAGTISHGVSISLRAESSPASRAKGLYFEGGGVVGLRVTAGEAPDQESRSVPVLARGSLGFLRGMTLGRQSLYAGAGVTALVSTAGDGVCLADINPCSAAIDFAMISPRGAIQLKLGSRTRLGNTALGIDLTQEFTTGDDLRRLFIAAVGISLW